MGRSSNFISVSRVGRLVRRASILVATTLALQACSYVNMDGMMGWLPSSSGGQDIAVPQATEPDPQTGPVINFVTTARVGDRQSITDPKFGGLVLVTVLREYTSASGRKCKGFSAGHSQTMRGVKQEYVICTTGSGWFLAKM